MTASSPSGGGGDNAAKLRHSPSQAAATTALSSNHNHNQVSSTSSSSAAAATTASGLSFSSSAAFQQVKQTQASLARLCRVHQQAGHHQNNQSSQHMVSKVAPASPLDAAGQRQQQRTTTFVDCLIRRFKNCFSEDSCVVPMFVVGNLNFGSDGTHLILPPCVSLGGQSISRFSSPKNLRLMNSIRESCRTIEELDLGDNKLTDLIEVYKILQCMPNLRFLNLSENDLSRTSPVAMASSSTSLGGQQQQQQQQQHFSTSLTAPLHMATSTAFTTTGHLGSSGQLSSPGQRAYLTPINQNNRLSGAMATRRHSTLGQPTTLSSNASTTLNGSTSRSHLATGSHRQAQARSRTSVSRITETRRLAAANAIAQSRKTSSSSVGSKLTNSATPSSASCRTRELADNSSLAAASGASGNASATAKSGGAIKQTRSLVASARHHTVAASTMHLARSMSSLSARDLRAASSGISRLGMHRSGVARNIESRSSGLAKSHRSSIESIKLEALAASQAPGTSEQPPTLNKITTSTSHQKLFVDLPIAETEDVDMSAEQQVSPGGQGSSGARAQEDATECNAHQATVRNSQEATITGSNNKTTAASTTLRSVCNSNTNFGLLTTQQVGQTTNFRRTFESVKALALNNTGCQWKVVCSILSRMPNLEELHLSLNNYERIDLEPSDFRHPALKRLYLCNNPKLTNWEELDKLLVAFPSLQALSIADCNISQIPDNLDRSREWRKLCGLNINGWPIKEWPVVERLNQLPSLIDLKCRNLDVLNNIDEPRHHLIARLPRLQRLNGSEIEEREHAERAFLRFFMVNSHLERPSRFHELMQIYGEVPQHVDVDVDLSPPTQASVRVVYLNRNYYRKENEDDVLMSEDFLSKLMDNVDANNVVVQDADGASNSLQENMELADTSSPSVADRISGGGGGGGGPVRLFKDAGQEVMALDVDLRQSVRKFKSTIASLFGLKSQNLILYYIDHEMVGLMGPELIKHNQKKLWNYNVQDGDQFIVEDQ